MIQSLAFQKKLKSTRCILQPTVTAGLLGGPVALPVRLSVCILLCVLQAELMAHLKRLADGPHDTHGLCLAGREQRAERTF